MGTRNKTKIIETKRTRSKSRALEVAAFQEAQINRMTRADRLNEKWLNGLESFEIKSSVIKLDADANIEINMKSCFNVGNQKVLVVRTKGGIDVLVIDGKVYHAEIMFYRTNENTDKDINRTSTQLGLQQTDLDGATIEEI